jgi:hypothetical protein
VLAQRDLDGVPAHLRGADASTVRAWERRAPEIPSSLGSKEPDPLRFVFAGSGYIIATAGVWSCVPYLLFDINRGFDEKRRAAARTISRLRKGRTGVRPPHCVPHHLR